MRLFDHVQAERCPDCGDLIYINLTPDSVPYDPAEVAEKLLSHKKECPGGSGPE